MVKNIPYRNRTTCLAGVITLFFFIMICQSSAYAYQYVQRENAYQIDMLEDWKLFLDGNSAMFIAPEFFDSTPITFTITKADSNANKLSDNFVKELELSLTRDPKRKDMQIVTRKNVQIDDIDL